MFTYILINAWYQNIPPSPIELLDHGKVCEYMSSLITPGHRQLYPLRI